MLHRVKVQCVALHAVQEEPFMFGRKKQPPVSPLENAVMHVLWERGTATADDVRQALEKSRELKESTIRTLLRRLEDKGYVTHDVDGRTFIYRPQVDPQN